MPARVIVGIGEVLWDVFPSQKHLGGAPANFACHARALGDDAVIASRVGRDSLGRELLAELGRLGMPTNHIQRDASRPTGTVRVVLDPTRQPRFIISPDAAWDHVALNDDLVRLARRADAVCYGTLAQRGPKSRAAIRGFVAAASRALKVCDLNLRAEFLRVTPSDAELMDVITRSLELADVLKLNGDELHILRRAFRRDERDDDFARWLIREFGLRLVCVTLGARGCVLLTRHARVVERGIRVKIADTVGAGDAFAAAMVNRLLRRRPLREVARFANRLGAYVASKPGATPSLQGFLRTTRRTGRPRPS